MGQTTHSTQVFSMFGGGYVPELHTDEPRGNLAPSDSDGAVTSLTGSMFSELLQSRLGLHQIAQHADDEFLSILHCHECAPFCIACWVQPMQVGICQQCRATILLYNKRIEFYYS